MNRRGQRETNGALGDFCVKCHAPVALREGLTRDGLNLDQVPAAHKGVSCYFCHSIQSVTGAHSNPLTLAADGAMLGPFADPVDNAFHLSRYSKNLDSTRPEAATACGSCHDIVNSKGTAIERTFAEWRGTLFSKTPGGLGCASCHMQGRDGLVAAVGTNRNRRVHDHRMPGIDVALTPWPGVEDQKKAIAEELRAAVQGTLCYDERSNRIAAILDNAGVGHMWPSGAASDRRAWVEIVAYANKQVIFQTGVADDKGPSASDPDLWMIRDCFFDERDTEVHMFWQASRFTSNLLPGAPLLAAGVPPMQRGHIRWDVPAPDSGRSLPAIPDRITMRVRIRAIGDDVIKDLVKSGDLDPSVAGKIPTFELAGGSVEWTNESVNFTTLERGSLLRCVAPPGYMPTTVAAVSHARCDHP
jgi:hypothetical protein